MPPLADRPLIRPADRGAWRAWLEANHASSSGAWVAVRRRSGADDGGLAYESAIQEAPCFGWVDATAGRLDERARG